jgi:hypothetical protein
MSKKGAEKLQECWQIMCAAQKQGTVHALGLYGSLGSIVSAMEIMRCNPNSVSILAADIHPHKDQDAFKCHQLQKVYTSTGTMPPIMTYNLFGPKNALLNCDVVQDVADDSDIDVHTLLFKWAEAQACGVLTSSVRDKKTWVSGKSEILPTYHRGLTRDYATGPCARNCAMELDNSLAGKVVAQSTADGAFSAMAATAPSRRRSVTIHFDRRGSANFDMAQTRRSSTHNVLPDVQSHRARRASTHNVLPSVKSSNTRRASTDTELPCVQAQRTRRRSSTNNSLPVGQIQPPTTSSNSTYSGRRRSMPEKFQSSPPDVSTITECLPEFDSKQKDSHNGESVLHPSPPSMARERAVNPVQAQRVLNTSVDVLSTSIGNLPHTFGLKSEVAKEVTDLGKFEGIFPDSLFVVGA